MVNKGRLKMALAHEKGVDFQKLHQRKKAKEADKKKQTKTGGAQEDEDWEEDDEEGESRIDVTAMMDDSASSDSEVEMETKIVRQPKSALKQTKVTTTKSKKAAAAAEQAEEDDEEDEEDEEEEEDSEEDPEAEDIAMSDLEDLEDEDRDDLVPHQRLTINNTVALEAALKRIALPTDDAAPFAAHLSVTGTEAATEAEIPDVMDDLQRELAFYGQALAAARAGRARCRKEGVPFARPNDYFAEMVKDDGHMAKVKDRLVQEASAKKASAEARKLRDLKKFGKQVQVAKLQERQKAKKDTLEKIQSLKRKRSENSGDLGTHEADLFDVGVEDELAGYDKKKRGGAGGGGGGAGGDRTANPKRQKKDAKFGFGGKKRHAKSGDAISSGDMSGFSAKRMKEKPQGTKAMPRKTARLGKSRRNAGKR